MVLSIDDLYLPHADQKALAKSHPNNPLVQHRGQPSTHDIDTGIKLFEALADRQRNIKIPSYDKSAFSGAGDRRPESEWETVNDEGELGHNTDVGPSSERCNERSTDAYAGLRRLC